MRTTPKDEVRYLMAGQRFRTCLTDRKGICLRETDGFGVKVALNLADDEWPDPSALSARVEVKSLAPGVVVLVEQGQ